MKARTLGPILMMTLGAAIVLMPATGWVGAQQVDPCLQPTPGAATICPCPETQFGVNAPCDTTTVAETTTTVAATTTIAETTTTAAATTTPATTVVLPSTTDIGSGGRGLPETGSTSSSYLVFGGLLFVAGASLLVIGRAKKDPVTT